MGCCGDKSRTEHFCQIDVFQRPQKNRVVLCAKCLGPTVLESSHYALLIRQSRHNSPRAFTPNAERKNAVFAIEISEHHTQMS